MYGTGLIKAYSAAALFSGGDAIIEARLVLPSRLHSSCILSAGRVWTRLTLGLVRARCLVVDSPSPTGTTKASSQ